MAHGLAANKEFALFSNTKFGVRTRVQVIVEAYTFEQTRRTKSTVNRPGRAGPGKLNSNAVRTGTIKNYIPHFIVLVELWKVPVSNQCCG